MPDTTWPISGHPPGSSRDRENTPVLMSSNSISTRHQWFTHVRLLGPHLTPSRAPFPHRSPRRSSPQRSMRRFGASLRRAAPRGHKPSSPAQHRIKYGYYNTPLSTFVAHSLKEQGASQRCGWRSLLSAAVCGVVGVLPPSVASPATGVRPEPRGVKSARSRVRGALRSRT